MTEARRFIRYLFPGLIFMILLFLYLLISDIDLFMINARRFLTQSKGGGIFEAGVFLLLVGGGGYFFATIYHSVSKIRKIGCRYPNHSGLLRDAVNRNWLMVVNRSVTPPEIMRDNFFPDQAWSILSGYYHARIHKIEFEKAHNRIESMNDTLHSLGASTIASVFAFFVWLLLHFYGHEVKSCDFYRWFSTFLLAIGISFVFWKNYCLTGVETQNFLDGITSQFLAEESRDGEWPITLYFPG